MAFATFHDIAAAIETRRDGDLDFGSVGQILSQITPRDVAALLRGLMTEVKQNGHLPMQREDHIYLYRERDFNLLLRFTGMGRSPQSYAANEYDAYLLNLSHREIEIPAFACSVDPARLDQRPEPLRPLAPVVVPPHGLHFEPAFGSVLDLVSATPPAPILVVHSEHRAWTTWTFDPATLEAEQRISTDLHASRIQLAMMLLSEMQAAGYEAPLAALATSRFAGFVRWDAVKLLHRRDRTQGFALLRQLADADADPEIREAARSTLKRAEGLSQR